MTSVGGSGSASASGGRPKALASDLIKGRIRVIRGQRVLLDQDLAALYGVETKALNRAVKRNTAKFPKDFMFQLSGEEFEALRCQKGTSKSKGSGTTGSGRGGRRYPPYAFTEHGALQVANVLNSPRATEMSVYVIRAFVKLRNERQVNGTILQRLTEIDKTLLRHNGALRDIYEKLQPLLEEDVSNG